jgi:hypothetical protein
MKRFMNKKVVTIGLAAGLALGIGGAAFAYFSSTGSGTGTASTGNTSAVTVVQDSITYNGPSDGAGSSLKPGDTATVDFGITNPGGNEYVTSISLASWTSNSPSTCDSGIAGQSGWFTMPTVPVGADFAHGTDTTTGKTGTITFNDDLTHSQDACAGKTITFSYTSN